MIGNWNPVITRGGGWDRTLTFTQDGSIFSLAGYTAAMTMTPATGTAVSPTLTINGAAGTVEAKLTATQVAAIDWEGMVDSVFRAIPSGVYGEAVELTGVAALV